ncbi:MAG: hypothetical protein HBSAPP04_27170 [Ignavibacteriaceae bacterium]|nr:MAG: hypothetical protein HBSAPP04_27170 [Ignavibacteriaceae bacterium]
MQTREQLQEQKYAMIEQWQQSGLSQKKYCEQNSIAYHHFHYWYKRYLTQRVADSAGTAGFVPVTLNTGLSAGCIELQLPDGKKLLFHQPIGVDYLKALIA